MNKRIRKKHAKKQAALQAGKEAFLAQFKDRDDVTIVEHKGHLLITVNSGSCPSCED